MTSYYLLLGVIFMLGILILVLQKKRVITKKQKIKYTTYLTQIKKMPSRSEQLIGLDKLYHNILKGYGYSGTFGEILKQQPRVIPNIQKIWDLHKLRNHLVHDMAQIAEPKLEDSVTDYIREINKIIR